MTHLRHLIREVHRRSLWQVLLIYVGAAWACYEIIDTITDRLLLPEWLPILAIVLFLIGLPIVLATAFVQEGTPLRLGGEPSAPSDGESPAASRAPTDRGRAERLLTWRNALMGAVFAFALWGLVAAGWLLLPGDERPSSEVASTAGLPEPGAAGASSDAERERFLASVAVLPFDNLGSPEDEYLSEGITEMITAQLAQVSRLKVISRTSVVAIDRASLTLPQIADTLRVKHVLEGTVQRGGDATRVTVQLIEAETDAHLWAQTYTRELTDLFELQDEIAREVTRALLTTIPPLRASGLTSRTEHSAVYEEYLRGKYWLHGRTREGLLRAMEAFREAVAVDSTYAPAYAGLAMASGLWVTYGYGGELDHYTAYSQGVAAADRAVSLDPELAEGYSARGYIFTKAWAPSDELARDFARALRLLPNSADVHGWYAHFLARERRFDEALSEAEQAVELDPIAPGRRNGFALDALGGRHYDLALREARRALSLEPQLQLPKALEAISLLLLGEAEECLDLELGPRAGVRALCLHTLGRAEEAEALIDSLSAGVVGNSATDEKLNDVVLVGEVASYYAWVGDVERAIDWLGRAYELSPSGLDFRIVYSGIFDPVRADPSFAGAWERLREEIWQRVREASRG